MSRSESLLLPIIVGVVIQMATTDMSVAQFVREEISVRVHGEFCMLDGRYEFKNTQDRAVLWPIFYPLLNTATIPLADSVRIQDVGTEEPIPFEHASNGVSFALTMPPLGLKAVRIAYRQRTPQRTMEYILTSTKQWGKPLELATFRIVIPDSLRLTHISMSYDSLVRRGHDLEYLICRRAFMPHSNLTIRWEGR